MVDISALQQFLQAVGGLLVLVYAPGGVVVVSDES